MLTSPNDLRLFSVERPRRIFLRKVGRGYIFIHRYLMEDFASLTEEEIERLVND